MSLLPTVLCAVITTSASAEPRWSVAGPATDHPVSFHVALQVPAAAWHAVEEMLSEVSDPNHVNYGQYLTPAALRKLSQSDPALSARVTTAFASYGIDCENLGSALKCVGPAPDVEAALQTTLARYVHTGTGATVARVAPGATVGLPAALATAEDIEFISGLHLIPSTARGRSTRLGSFSKDDPATVPETIRRMYNITVRGDPKVVQAAGEFPGNWVENATDLATFGANNGLVGLSIAKVAGHPMPPEADEPISGETTLDVDYVGGVGLSNTNWLWNADGWIFEIATAFQNASGPAALPSVVSLSYGWSEADQCAGSSPVDAGCKQKGFDNAQYINRTNFELQKVGLLGVTMSASSGDSGCHGRTHEECLLNAKMHPAFPAASPFITAVGGTQFDWKTEQPSTANASSPICQSPSGALAGNCAMSGTEIVSSTGTGSRISSGGGFSGLTPRPAYQDAAVKAYLATDAIRKLPQRIFNAEGRGYPDIAALAHNFYIQINGHVGSEDGTSASSPVIAGIVGLINAHRLRAGRPAVGFLNPLLYQIWAETNGTAFNDITVGTNKCTESGCLCHTGFEAEVGWDASTGLGTPNLGRMLLAIDAIDERREAMIKQQQRQ